MLWVMVKYYREGLVLIMAEAGFSIFSSRWCELMVFVHGLVWVIAAMVAEEKGWRAPPESPITRLSARFQGGSGFSFLLWTVCVPVLFASMFAGWAVKRLVGC